MKITLKKIGYVYVFSFYGEYEELDDLRNVFTEEVKTLMVSISSVTNDMLLEPKIYKDEIKYNKHFRLFVSRVEDVTEEFIRTTLFRLCDKSFVTTLKNVYHPFFNNLGSLIESGYFKNKIEEIEIKKD